MPKYHQLSQISLGIMGALVCALCSVQSDSLLNPSPIVSAPATATSSPATPTPFESQPVADGPVLLRADSPYARS